MVDDDDLRDSPADGDDVSRRSYMQILGALGAGGATSAGMTDSGAAASGGREVPQGITVSDSGTDIGDGVDRLNFAGSLSPVAEDENVNSVEVQPREINPHIIDVEADLNVVKERDDLMGAIEEHYHSFPPTERKFHYVLPDGVWHVESEAHFEAHEFMAIVGRPFSVLKVNDQDVDMMMTIGTIDTTTPNAQRTVMRDFQVDIRGQYDAGIIRAYTHQYGYFEDISMRGQRDRLNPDYGGHRYTIKIDGRQETTTNIMQGLILNNGDTGRDRPTSVGHAIPFSSEPYNRGTNLWEACQVRGYIDNGFYVSTNSGRNVLLGCHARNCAGAGIRIGANDYAEDCSVHMTEEPEYPWSGLWIENGGGMTVDGFNLHNEVEKPTEMVRLTHNGPARVTGLHIVDEGGTGRAIRVDGEEYAQTVFSGCTIQDRSSPSTSDYAVYVRESDVVFRDVEIDLDPQSDVNRHGIFLSSGGGDINELSMYNTRIRHRGDNEGASLRFGESGASHDVLTSKFEGLVMSDPGVTLENTFWVGNRHQDRTVFHGDQVNWKGDFNFGYELPAD